MFDKQLKERVRILEAIVQGLEKQHIVHKTTKELLEGQVEKLMDQLSVKQDALDSLVTAHASLLDQFREQSKDLKEARTQPEQVSWMANVPLHVSEDEEEARWQLENGLIDRELFSEILSEVGLDPNIDIQV